MINFYNNKAILPDNASSNTHAMKFDLDDECRQLVIEFVNTESGVGRTYSMYPRNDGYHSGSGAVRDTILHTRGAGRYECEWNDDEQCLVVDLKLEVMDSQTRFELNL